MKRFTTALVIAAASNASPLEHNKEADHPFVTAMTNNEKIAIGGLAALTAFSAYTTYS